MKKFIMISLVAIILSSCSSNNNVDLEAKYFFKFTGELLSVIDQRKYKDFQSFGGQYTVTITKASPEIDRFKEYNESNLTQDDMFFITEQTHIYRENQDGSKALIKPAELEVNRGKIIEFWVNPIKNKEWYLEFELIEVIGTIARYRFGKCLLELDGVIELDLTKLKRGEIPGDTPINEVVKLINDNQKQSMANRVFSKIYKHFLEHNEYPVKGGYYA